MEKQCPALAAPIRAIVKPNGQADPKFQTPLAFTRMTAKAVCKQVAARAGRNSRRLRSEP